MTSQAPAATLRLAAARPPLPLLVDLLASFHEQQISYCYWKSGSRVGQALAGETDLDLLIMRDDQHFARRVLLEHGLKEFPVMPSRDHPAMSSFLGYDAISAAIVHVHVHFRLVLGGKLLNEYRLPWEKVLLERCVMHSSLPIRVLDAESEALLVIVRACLELKRTDLVALRNWRAASGRFEQDRRELRERVNREVFRGRVAEALGAGMADEIEQTLFGHPSVTARHGIRRRLRRALAVRRAYNGPEAFARNLSRGLAWIAGGANSRVLHLPRPWGRRACGGGFVIAVVGVDGSGKSTVVRYLRDWLGAAVDTMPVYFGTGDGRPSLPLLPFKLLVPFVRRAFPSKPKGASHGRVSDQEAGPLYSVLFSAWAALVATEKRGKLRSAHRAAARGLIVVADRYPQDENRNYNDGPLLHRARWSPGWLRRYEARTYRSATAMPPDLVLKLDVEPETAVRRETDMNPGVIAERVAALRQLTFAGARVVRVDAERPLAEVLRAVRREVWRML